MSTIADKLTALAAVKEAQRVALSLGTGVPFSEYVDNFPSGGTPEWTPLDLPLGAGLVGDYRPWDLSTLFQDAAGTMPVTADGQPVGLILDKSPAGNHLSTEVLAHRMTYKTDGVKSWLFQDGIDDKLEGVATALSNEVTIVAAVATPTNAGGGGQYPYLGWVSSSSNRALTVRTASAVQFSGVARTASGAQTGFSGSGLFPNQSNGLTYVHSMTISADKTMRGFLDGTERASVDVTASLGVTLPDTPIVLGTISRIDFYGGAVFTTALSAADRLKVEGYYGSKRWVS